MLRKNELQALATLGHNRNCARALRRAPEHGVQVVLRNGRERREGAAVGRGGREAIAQHPREPQLRRVKSGRQHDVMTVSSAMAAAASCMDTHGLAPASVGWQQSSTFAE